MSVSGVNDRLTVQRRMLITGVGYRLVTGASLVTLTFVSTMLFYYWRA